MLGLKLNHVSKKGPGHTANKSKSNEYEGVSLVLFE